MCWHAFGVNACGIQHNCVFCDLPPVARQARLVSSVRRSAVMSCAPLLCRVACVQATLRPHVSVLARKAAPAQSFSQALRAAVVCGVPARPCALRAHRVCRLRAPPRFALRVRARRHTLPVRPSGAPLKVKSKTPSTTIHGHLQHKCRESARPDCTLHF